MTAPREGLPPGDRDAFLRDLAELDAEGLDDLEASLLDLPAAHGLVRLTESLEGVTPSASLRERLLADAPTQGRFARFAEATAKLLDLGVEQARALLEKLEDSSVFSAELPGVDFFWCEGGPAVANAVRGFVKVKAGLRFPDHEHVGDEVVLVLQGSFVDEARGLTFTAGDIDRMPAGSAHDFYVPAGGPDLLKLSVTQVAIKALGHTYLPRP